MDELELSTLCSAGTLICATMLCVAFLLSCVVLKSRGGITHGRTTITDLPLCNICHQHQEIDPLDETQTKGWTCSACNGYNPTTEVSSGDIDNDPTDLEIQHTLGSLAISQTRTLQVRASDSPRSWLHSIKDLNLLPEQTPNQSSSDGDLCEKDDESLVNQANSNGSQPSSLDSSKYDEEVQGSSLTSSFSVKPIIHPARLQVRKRQVSISSATAALSLAGNGWSLNSHVTENTCKRLANGGRPSRPLLNGGQFINHRHSATNLQQNFSGIQPGCTNHHNHVMSSTLGSRLGNGNSSLANGRVDRSSQSKDLDNLNLSGLTLSQTSLTNHHGYQNSLTKRQPQSVVPRLDYSVVNGNKSPPPGNGLSCPVATLLLLSLSVNVVLILLLVMFIYRPTIVLSVL